MTPVDSTESVLEKKICCDLKKEAEEERRKRDE
jgi:hypothetical protein